MKTFKISRGYFKKPIILNAATFVVDERPYGNSIKFLDELGNIVAYFKGADVELVAEIDESTLEG